MSSLSTVCAASPASSTITTPGRQRRRARPRRDGHPDAPGHARGAAREDAVHEPDRVNDQHRLRPIPQRQALAELRDVPPLDRRLEPNRSSARYVTSGFSPTEIVDSLTSYFLTETSSS